jgi:integrase
MARQKRDSRGYFNVTIAIGRDGTGKRIRKRLRSKTLGGLREKQEAALSDKKAGKLTTGVKPTLEDFLSDWLEQVVKIENRQSTYERYGIDVRSHIIPGLGRVRVDKLDNYAVQTWVNDLTAKRLAPRTVRHAFGCLHHSYATAIHWSLATHNPCDGTVLPKVSAPNIGALTVDEARRLLAELHGHRLEALFWMALLLGLRQGELLALGWSDVDLDRGEVRVQGSLRRLRLHPEAEKGKRSELVITPPKTQKGARLLGLLPPLDTILLAHKARQDEERTQTSWKEHGLVFPSEAGTPFDAVNLVENVYRPALNRAGLPSIRFHSLRHTTVSLLISLGVDGVTASAIAGHASAAFTQAVYGHALPDPIRAALARLGNEFVTDQVLEIPPRKVEQDR